ncbi:hypothetical protein [Halomicrobium salinisoli]|uniref:hypothetical protein n=1 Tax=Halomicrobium salinisoli TaxID=2878391 RepID=UPI001CF0587F|nr:hypothetical protein [Halomicrobium salinisoli]
MTGPFDESETKSQPDSGWIYVAPDTVKHQTGRVVLPDGLFEAGILEDRGTAHWAYDRVVGVVILSNAELEDDEYHTVDEMSIYGDRQCKIPEPFFPPDHDARPDQVSQAVHEKAHVRRGERRHFVYQVGMDEGETRSCYLLTDEQLQKRISSADDWVGNFDSIPKFF